MNCLPNNLKLGSPLIKNIIDVIGSYREDDLIIIDEAHVEKWINQFDENDRDFILQELVHILPKSYLTKEQALINLDSVFEELRKHFRYESIEKLLNHVCFLQCQKDYKSQSIILNFFDELLIDKYGRSVNHCGSEEVRYWLYVDDVLASGGTCRKDLVKTIEEYGKDDFKNSRIKIICCFFIAHHWGGKNCRYSIGKEIGYELKSNKLQFSHFDLIENNPRIHNHWNPSPKFNHIYPIKCQEGKDFLKFIEKAFERDYPMSKEEFAFRNSGYPKKETFFSSAENRNRYELILLKKGIEIMHEIENIKAQGLRPLGMTPPGYKTLGTGTHYFTWRNISNTCPLVFWWEANGWHPLFPVKNRGN